MSDAEVARLVARREEARAAKDYKLADRMRDDLNAKGVYVDDRMWRTIDGRSGIVGVKASDPAESLTEDQIAELVAEREEAHRTGQFDERDRVRDQLRAAGVSLVDTPGKHSTWRTHDGRVGVYDHASHDAFFRGLQRQRRSDL